MKKTLDNLIEKISQYGLTVKEFFILYKHYNILAPIEPSEEELLSLQTRGWIKILDSGYDLRGKAIKIFNKLFEEEEPIPWIQEYRDLFKVSNKVGAMGDLKGVDLKFKAFFKDYPQYNNKELIFKATKAYINSNFENNYKYLQRADYFIYKNRTSRLAAYCESVKDEKEEDYNSTLV